MHIMPTARLALQFSGKCLPRPGEVIIINTPKQCHITLCCSRPADFPSCATKEIQGIKLQAFLSARPDLCVLALLS